MEAHIISLLEKHTGVKGRFPGGQPVSIEYKHFPILRNNQYLVCEKTDGQRYVLVLTIWENKKVCVFVNRKMEMFESKMFFNREIHNDTILDGELYDGNQYLVYDCYVHKGESLLKEIFTTRWQRVLEIVNYKYKALKNDSIKVASKTFHILQDFDVFQKEYLPHITQRTDGLIFTPANDPVMFGTQETMFKWKPQEKNTVDFQMVRGDKTWRLYVQEKGKLYYESELPPNTPEEDWFEEGAIVECQYMFDDVPMWWKPLLRRHDKTYPNNRRTFYRTLVNIKEDIKMDDFYNLSKEMNL